MFKKAQQKLRNRKGFTLIELIVVIAIIAILAAVLIPRFTGFTENARQKSAISDTRNILLGIDALLSEGNDTSITIGDVEAYTGKHYPGIIAPTAITATIGDNFTYTVSIGGYSYVVAVNVGVIDTTFGTDDSTLDSTSSYS